MKKAITAVCLAGTMACSLISPAAGWADERNAANPAGIWQREERADERISDLERQLKESAESSRSDEEESPGIRYTDLRISIKREDALMEEAGMSLDEWDRRTAEKKKEGLKHPVTEESILEADPEAEIRKEDGRIYYIGGSAVLDPVREEADAYRAVYEAVLLLGGSSDTDLRIWSRQSIDDKTIYSFQQVSDSREVLGSVIKLVAEKDGSVSAVFSSLKSDAAGEENLASREEAEDAVLQHLKDEGTEPEIIPGETIRIIRTPYDFADLTLDEESDPVPEELYWVVFSTNTQDDAAAYPYLAHYVKLDGSYAFSLSVKTPGDEESRSGYRKQDVFEGMTPGEWSGQITDGAGNEKTVTVPVMYSGTEDKWYLGDTKRRIAVCDYAQAAYGETHTLKPVENEENDGWDNEDLIMLHNYIRAWDFYNDMGWNGPDGQGTDIIILKELCNSSGEVYENACSIGRVNNFEMFGYTGYNAMEEPLKLVHGLDVMAHEYTHTFTSTVMNENLYENDQGAINEAMSDIMGNIIEYICQDTDDTNWIIGENMGMPIRSMRLPHLYDQPEYVWDVYYGPHTDKPLAVNDRGGVHSNSSLLSRIAALLCLDQGMTYDEAVSFWLMTACGLTPGTDYVQMETLLPWALQASGNDKYMDALRMLMEEEALTRTEFPEEIPENQKVVSLTLPDNEVFRDENWGLVAISMDQEYARLIVQSAVKIIRSMFHEEDWRKTAEETLLQLERRIQTGEAGLEAETMKKMSDESFLDLIADTFTAAVYRIFGESMTWRETLDSPMRMVAKEGPALYVLLNASENGMKMRGAAVLLGNTWYDAGAMIDSANPDGEDTQEPDPVEGILETLSFLGELTGNLWKESREQLEADGGFHITGVLEKIGDAYENVSSLLSGEPDIAEKKPEMVPARTEELPTAGLDAITLS